MRTTILTRSVVALATLAVGSVALAATPANAAAANGVTRDQVITAVNGVRTANANDTNLTLAAERAVNAITNRGCDVLVAEGERAEILNLRPATAGDDADGLLITAGVDRGISVQLCTFAAFATTDGSFQLSGNAVVSGTREGASTPTVLSNQALSGDAFVTAAISADIDYENATASAAGNATKTTVTPTSKKVTDKKTKSEKKKAKASYTKRIKSAKKSYAKALDKAGKSKSKKAKAKKAYSAKRASAKKTYRTAVSDFKIVKGSTSSTENRAFTITVAAPPAS